MVPRGLQDAPRARHRKGLDIDSCRVVVVVVVAIAIVIVVVLALFFFFAVPFVPRVQSTDRQLPMTSALRKGGCFLDGLAGSREA